MALNASSGKPVTPASVRMGLPTPPHATGAVLATRQSVAASNGLKPRPMRNAPAIATGAPPPPAPSEEGAEAEGDQHQLQPFVRRQAGDRRLHHLELTGFARDVVEKDRPDDDPGDPHQPEDDAVHRGGADERRRHAEDEQRQRDGDDESAHRRHPDTLLQRDEHEEQRDDRQCRQRPSTGGGSRTGRRPATRT